MKKKSTKFAVACIASLFCLHAVAAEKSVHAKKAHYYFTVTATSSEFKPLADGKQYQLVLHNAAPDVLWLADRPVRKSGLITMTQFMQAWDSKTKNNFTVNPPNAEFISRLPDAAHTPVIYSVEITHPSVSNQDVTFDVKFLNKGKALSPTAKDLNNVYKDSFLVVDDWGDSPEDDLPCSVGALCWIGDL